MGKVYDVAYKIEVCKRVTEGSETVPSISRELGINENTLYTWVSRYRQNSVKPFVGSGHIKPEDVELNRLQREIRELRYGKPQNPREQKDNGNSEGER